MVPLIYHGLVHNDGQDLTVTSTFSRETKWAITVEPENLRKIVAEMNLDGKLTITAGCVDRTDRKFENVEELIKYANPWERRIQTLTFESASATSPEVIYVRLGLFSWRTTEIRIIGDDSFVSNKRDQILTELAGARPWYAFLHLTDPLTAILVIFVTFLVSLSFLYVFGAFGPPKRTITTPSSEIPAAYFIVWTAYFFAGVGILKILRHIIFPAVSFRIGHQEKRFQTLEKFRWLLVSALVIGPIGRVCWSTFT